MSIKKKNEYIEPAQKNLPLFDKCKIEYLFTKKDFKKRE